MKRAFLIIVGIVLAGALGTAVAFALEAPARGAACPNAGQCAGFTDADGDGVCDNLAAGLCTGRGAHFIDENGDGVCDNRDADTAGQGCGGNGNGVCGMGRGCGNGGCGMGRAA